MAIDQTTTAGTESPDDGNELEQPASTAPEGSDDRNAESGGDKTDWKALAISLQEKAKRVNELEAKVKSYEEQVDDVDQPPDDPGAAPAKGTYEWFLAQGDPVARRQAALERKIELDSQLAEMPAEIRSEVKAHWHKNLHRLGDMNAARAELERPKLDAENRRLREENERLKRGPDPEVMNAPPTGGREVTARERRAKLTEAQFEEQSGNIRREQGELAYLKYVRANAGNVSG